MCDVQKNTVLRLLAEVGDACQFFFDDTVRGVQSRYVQCDEIWSFCHAKERNLPRELRGAMGVGDVWTWTAIDADSKVVVTWHLGKRTTADADAFISDLAERIVSDRVQISTDGLTHYNLPIQRYFHHRADHGSEVKDYGLLDDDTPERKYSPMVVKQVHRKPVWGVPDTDRISTAYVERNNLTMRMSSRRFTRLTNGYSKKMLNLNRALALHFMHYNFVRKHHTLKGKTPAMAAGLTDRFWTLRDLALLPDILRNREAA
jgi:IS1 family transposase